MSDYWRSKTGLGISEILSRAEFCEDMAVQYPDAAENWQAQANAWRVELPPAEIDPPGPVIDSDFIDIEP